jgi:hypothetical protein
MSRSQFENREHARLIIDDQAAALPPVSRA